VTGTGLTIPCEAGRVGLSGSRRVDVNTSERAAVSVVGRGQIWIDRPLLGEVTLPDPLTSGRQGRYGTEAFSHRNRVNSVSDSRSTVTELLEIVRGGNREAAGQLFELLQGELKRSARKQLRDERRNHTLQPSALVNETYMRLMGGQTRSWENRLHFLKHATQAMRRTLIDYARARRADKRGGAAVFISLDDRENGPPEPQDDVETRLAGGRADQLAVAAAMTALAAVNPEQANALRLRFFFDLSDREIAGRLGVSERTVFRHLRAGKLRLREQLTPHGH
jgi:RNA polymerase sigma-70 factor (ECF subfamily)